MPSKFYYLITGASSGIGYATALELASRPDVTVIAVARSANKLAQLKQASGDRIISCTFDLASGDPQSLLTFLAGQGIDYLNGILHNAGQLINKPFESITADDLQVAYTVNVFAPFLVTQALLPLLIKAEGAHIVHIGSVGGVQGSVKFPGLSAYSSSKGAISVLTECLATELAEKNIRVNCLALGAVQTEMLSQAFPGYEAPLTAAQMGEFVSWFMQNGQRFFNGKILPVALSTP
jgi:NAD(P)-dependent dehydrogenase (short-subunit alcohol dehydrogenase family)